MNKLLIVLLVSFHLGVHAAPQSSELSDASALVADGSAIVVGGSLLALSAAGSVVVKSVEVAGDAVVLVLKSASDGAEASLRFTGRAANKAALPVGTGVQVVGRASGHVLIAAGQVIAFLPTAAGRALVHHSRSGA